MKKGDLLAFSWTDPLCDWEGDIGPLIEIVSISNIYQFYWSNPPKLGSHPVNFFVIRKWGFGDQLAPRTGFDLFEDLGKPPEARMHLSGIPFNQVRKNVDLSVTVLQKDKKVVAELHPGCTIVDVDQR